MAAEIPSGRDRGTAPGRGFNEAAANGRGNHGTQYYAYAGGTASMRPRRMAAEIPLPAPRQERRIPASMRPRRMAAEISVFARGRASCLPASMRPRRMAAEITPLLLNPR